MLRFAILFCLFVIFLFSVSSLAAQEVWSLEKCIQYAQENSLDVKQAQASMRTGVITEKQAKASRLPNLNLTGNFGQNFGRTIDPTTNRFETTNILFNSYGMNAGVILFNGGAIHNSVKQADLNLKAAEASVEDTYQSLAISVANAYLSVLVAEENYESAQRRVALSRKQLENTQKMVDAGSMPLAERYVIDAQLAGDEQNAVTALNTLELNYLALKQLLLLEPDYDMVIERPQVVVPQGMDPERESFSETYAIAESTQPSIKAAEYNLMSAAQGVKVAQAAYWPRVSAFVNMNTNFSSLFRNIEVDVSNQIVTRDVLINGDPATITEEFPVTNAITTDVGYFDQLDQNFGQGYGINLNVPIYQNGQTRLSVERARLAVIQEELRNNQVRNQLKNDVQQAIANARGNKRLLEASQSSYNSFKTAFENTEKRFNLGAANTLELNTAKTNLDNAENDLIIAKYSYLYAIKILEFYQGKPLTLD